MPCARHLSSWGAVSTAMHPLAAAVLPAAPQRAAHPGVRQVPETLFARAGPQICFVSMSAATTWDPTVVATSAAACGGGPASTTPSWAAADRAMKYELSPGLYQTSSAPPSPVSVAMTVATGPDRSSMIIDAVEDPPQPSWI